MSKKFERIVLDKLGNLQTEVKGMSQRLGEVENISKDMNQRLEKVEVLSKDMNQRLGKVEIELKDTGEAVMDIRERFTIFDFEINKKIDTLFDSDTVNKDNIISLNTRTFNHDTRISNLENKDLQLVKL